MPTASAEVRDAPAQDPAYRPTQHRSRFKCALVAGRSWEPDGLVEIAALEQDYLEVCPGGVEWGARVRGRLFRSGLWFLQPSPIDDTGRLG
jgi:hypothetical protein